MTTLAEARAAYLKALDSSDALNALRVTVSSHGGSFDLAEMITHTKASPGAVLALMGFDLDVTEGYLRCDGRWGVVCFAEDRPARDRSDLVVEVAAAVAEALVRGFADLDVETKPQNVSAKNLFDRPIDFKGLGMWGVEFESSFELTSSTSDADLTDLQGIDAVWDVTPREDAPLGELPEARDSISL